MLVEPSGKSSVLTWFVPVPKSICVSLTESVARLNTPEIVPVVVMFLLPKSQPLDL